MELGKRMNKDIVEFIFEPKFSPLKRNTLSKEIKAVTQVQSPSTQLLPESKLEILNYLINSLSSTTNSITAHFSSHPTRSIEALLEDFSKQSSAHLHANQVLALNYKEIPVNTKIEAFKLIEDNSEIRKDNYSIMFDSIKITLDELINPKPKSIQHTPKNTRPRASPYVSSQRRKLKVLSKTFNLSINLNDSTLNEEPSVSNRPLNCKANSFKVNNQVHFDSQKGCVPSVSKNEVNSSVEIKEMELSNMSEDVFKKKMVNGRMNKKKGSYQTKLVNNKPPKSKSKTQRYHNNTILGYNSKKTEGEGADEEPAQQQSFSFQKTNGVPLPLNSNYHKPSLFKNNSKANDHSKNISNSYRNNNSYILSTSHNNHDTSVKETESRNKSQYKLNSRLQKRHFSSKSSSQDKKEPKGSGVINASPS